MISSLIGFSYRIHNSFANLIIRVSGYRPILNAENIEAHREALSHIKDLSEAQMNIACDMYSPLLRYIPTLCPLSLFLLYKLYNYRDNRKNKKLILTLFILGGILSVTPLTNFGVLSYKDIAPTYSLAYKSLGTLQVTLSGAFMSFILGPGLMVALSVPRIIVYYLTGITGNPDHETCHMIFYPLFFIISSIWRFTDIFSQFDRKDFFLLTVVITVVTMGESMLWSHGLLSIFGMAVNKILSYILLFLGIPGTSIMAFITTYIATMPEAAVIVIKNFGGNVSIDSLGRRWLGDHFIDVQGRIMGAFNLGGSLLENFPSGDNAYSTVRDQLPTNYFYSAYRPGRFDGTGRMSVNFRNFFPISNNIFENPIKMLVTIIELTSIVIGYIRIHLYGDKNERTNYIFLNSLLVVFILMRSLPNRLVGHQTYWLIMAGFCGIGSFMSGISNWIGKTRFER